MLSVVAITRLLVLLNGSGYDYICTSAHHDGTSNVAGSQHAEVIDMVVIVSLRRSPSERR